MAKDKPEKPTGKSIWRGRDGDEINVEILALQYYEGLGYKGYAPTINFQTPYSYFSSFHCEGRIVTTLFGFLFWDIIFAPVPGAFETPWQLAPLDIAEDTFYRSRKDIVDARLKEIEDGRAVEILGRFYDLNCGRKTVCVGVRWDLFERRDLVEIAQVCTSMHRIYARLS